MTGYVTAPVSEVARGGGLPLPLPLPLTPAELIRRLEECLTLYDRVLHPVAADPARAALEQLLADLTQTGPT